MLESILPLAGVGIAILEYSGTVPMQLSKIITRTFLPGNDTLKGFGLVLGEMRLRLLVLVGIELVEGVRLLSTQSHTPLRDLCIRLKLGGIVAHVLKEVEILRVHTLLRLITGELIPLVL